MLATLLIIIGFLVLLVGVAGCILPGIPGPALAFCSLVILGFAKGFSLFSGTFWIVMLLLLLLVTLADFFVPLLGAQKYGASKKAMLGGTIGMIVGIFFFPPFGIFIGAFLGAVIAEMVGGSETSKALNVGWGVLVGSLASMGLQLGYCMVALFYYVHRVFFFG
ncbi:MAG: DUF456 domain-containing protein [Desulfatibacillum sp.]|nr:DUF456 domain-containing protein [Desulfatibacillum sp.]